MYNFVLSSSQTCSLLTVTQSSTIYINILSVINHHSLIKGPVRYVLNRTFTSIEVSKTQNTTSMTGKRTYTCRRQASRNGREQKAETETRVHMLARSKLADTSQSLPQNGTLLIQNLTLFINVSHKTWSSFPGDECH